MAGPRDIAPQRRLRVVDDPGWEAYQLRLQGWSPADIVKKGKLGFSSTAEVTKTINKRVKLEARKMDAEERDTILAIMLDQCDALIKAYWTLAINGSVNDAKFVLDTIRTKAHLAQVDLPDAHMMGQTVLVVSGDEDDYVRALRGGHASENGSKEA
jgi:hypothetical protein